MADRSMIEDDFDVPVPPGGARCGDGLMVLAQAEARADEAIGLYLWRHPEGELEALDTLSLVLFDPVGVGPGEVYLFEPEGGQVKAAPRGRHPDEGHLPGGSREAYRVLHRPRGPYALEHFIRPAHDDRFAELWFVGLRAELGGERRVGLLRMNDLVGTKPEGFFFLAFVLGDADHAPGAGQLPQRRDDEEADAAGSDHDRRLVLLRVRLQGSVDCAGEGLYRH